MDAHVGLATEHIQQPVSAGHWRWVSGLMIGARGHTLQ